MATSNRSICKLDHCNSQAYSLGYCQSHYNRNYRTGDPLSVQERIDLGLIPAPSVKCSVKGCGRNKRSGGMCSRHYSNLSRYGHATPRRDWSVEDTLDDIGWEVTDAGCWEWRGARNDSGYGDLTLGRQGLYNARVHRLMYERFIRPIPDGLIVRHKCDNPPCVNPDHLEVGTYQDNSDDMIKRGRHWRHGATECRNGHDLTDPSSYRFEKRSGRGGEKVCLACQRERHLRWQEKKKLERAKLRDTNQAS